MTPLLTEKKKNIIHWFGNVHMKLSYLNSTKA